MQQGRTVFFTLFAGLLLAAGLSGCGKEPAAGKSAAQPAPEVAARLGISGDAAEPPGETAVPATSPLEHSVAGGNTDAGEGSGAPEGESTADVRDVQQLYMRSCHACHTPGVTNAPRAHDTGAWAPRLEKGMDLLVVHARNGFMAMPPRGLCFDCSDAEYRALIRFMSTDKAH